MRLSTGAAFLLSIVPALAFGTPTSQPIGHAEARRTETPPVIDGALDDTAWLSADWVDRFVQKSPDNGAAPSRKTSFAVLFDEAHLYFGVRCFVNSPDEIVTRLVRRDREADFDTIEITLSPREDNRTGYSFSVNPSGVMRDRYWSEDNVSDPGWDAVWYAETGRTREAWTVEMAIPLIALRIPRSRSRFGLQVVRWIATLRETDVFNPVPLNQGGTISNAGTLTGVGDIKGRLPRIFIPETYLSLAETTDDFESRREDGLRFGGGAYAKIGLKPDLVLDVAMLPDFGQVEVDEVVLNLSTYETRFPEKRPFFLEGAGLFSTPLQLFYSRRLGQPPADPDLDDDETIIRGASLTPILGAAKVTGRTRNGLSLGVIDAILLPTEFLVENDVSGQRTRKAGSPWTNASVLRAVNEIGAASTIGILGTALNPYGSDGAYVGGLDWNAVSPDRLYAFKGQVAGSARFDTVNNADPTNGAAFWTQIGRLSGQPVRYQASYRFVSKGFDSNDLGYEQRSDLHRYVLSADCTHVEGFGPFKQAYMGAGIDGSWNLDGVRLNHSGWFWQSAYWRNNWFTEYTVYGGIPSYDDKETRGDHPLRRPAFVGGELSVNSPPEKPVGFQIGAQVGSQMFGYTVIGWSTLALRLGRLDLSLSPRITRTLGGVGYVDTLNDGEIDETAVIGRRDLTELNVSLQGTLVFTRDLTFQLRSQLLNVSADYSRYSRVLEDGRLSPITYADENGAALEGDFARTDLVIQALLRFEYRPGSTVFLIYIHRGFVNIEESGARIRETLGRLDDEAREQIFMVKLSHRFE